MTRRTGDGGQYPGQGRADHQAELVGQPEHGVPGHPLLSGEQRRDQRVLARDAPGAEQRRYAEQSDVTCRAEQLSQGQAGDQAESGRPQHGVDKSQPCPAAAAQPAAQGHRPGRSGQRVGRDGGPDPQPAAALGGQPQGQPGDGHRAHPVAQRGGRRARQDPAQHRMAQRRVVRRGPDAASQPGGPAGGRHGGLDLIWLGQQLVGVHLRDHATSTAPEVKQPPSP
jgi:hypothetical protein